MLQSMGLRRVRHDKRLNNNKKYIYTYFYIFLVLPTWFSGKRICPPRQELQETLVLSLGQKDPLE